MQYFWDQKKQKGFTPTPNFGVSLQSKRGFTLVELLVVIAVIAILFAVILLALNPAQRFKDSRNARRLTDVRSIVDAVATYTADKKGALPANIPDGQCIGSKPADSFSTNPTGSTAVWKFDTSYADSQPVANNLVSLATTFTTGSAGKFGEAIQMNGSTSSLSAADHAELDPASSALTLEGWVKLNQKIEPGSFDHHQALFDKGNYRLQLNSDSGKLEFEVQNSIAPSWGNDTISDSDIKGVTAITQFQGALYGGALTTASAGKILKKNASTWSNTSNYPSGSTSINALVTYNSKLYSGQSSSDNSGRVYSFDGSSWKDTGLNIANSSVLSLVRYKGKLYAGIGIEPPNTGGASIWVYDGTSWSLSRQFTTSEALAIYSLAVFNGKLYVGTGAGTDAHPAHVFELNGTVWTIGSVLDYTKAGVYSLSVYEKELFIGLGGGGVNDGVIYKWNGISSSLTIVEGGYNFSRYALSFGVQNGTLYAGWGGSANGDARIYYWDRTSLLWSPTSAALSAAEVRSIYPYRGVLYSGTRGSTAIAEVKIYGNNGFIESQKSTWYPNTWYHVAGTYDGTSSVMNTMINGYLNSTSNSGIPATLASNSKALYVGSGYGGDAFDGTLDHFALFNNTAASQSTIATHSGCYNLGQYIVPEYMGKIPDDPSSTVTDGTDTGYSISQTGGVVTITAPLSEITSSIPEIIKSSR